MTASPDHTPCVLTPDCGPHCGLDRGYLGHCSDCHLGYGTGQFGHHNITASWLRLVQQLDDGEVLRRMPDLSPRPG